MTFYHRYANAFRDTKRGQPVVNGRDKEILRTGAIQIREFLGAFVIRAPSGHSPVLLRGRHHRVRIGIVLEHRIFVDLALGLHRRQEVGRHRTCGRRGLS